MARSRSRKADYARRGCIQRKRSFGPLAVGKVDGHRLPHPMAGCISRIPFAVGIGPTLMVSSRDNPKGNDVEWLQLGHSVRHCCAGVGASESAFQGCGLGWKYNRRRPSSERRTCRCVLCTVAIRLAGYYPKAASAVSSALCAHRTHLRRRRIGRPRHPDPGLTSLQEIDRGPRPWWTRLAFITNQRPLNIFYELRDASAALPSKCLVPILRHSIKLSLLISAQLSLVYHPCGR
jgi:hypothetical protein